MSGAETPWSLRRVVRMEPDHGPRRDPRGCPRQFTGYPQAAVHNRVGEMVLDNGGPVTAVADRPAARGIFVVPRPAVLPKEWRLFGPLEGLTGILMCGLSTGLFFAILSRMTAPRLNRGGPEG